MTPQAQKKLRSPGTGPTKGLPSGAKVNGPLITRLMPARSSGGKWAKASSRLGAIRSRSGVSSSWPKSAGVVCGDQGTHAFS